MFKILSVIKNGGYLTCYTDPPHPNRNKKGNYALHRVVVENKLGRILTPLEHVHHIDGNKLNNEPENLIALTRSEHTKIHHDLKPVELIECACKKCGKSFKLLPSVVKTRVNRNKTKSLFCSRSCGTTYKQTGA